MAKEAIPNHFKVCIPVCICVHRCMWGSGDHLPIVPQILFTLLFETGSHMILSWPTWIRFSRQALVICLPLPLQCWGDNYMTPWPSFLFFFNVTSEDQTQTCMLIRQALYWWSPFSASFLNLLFLGTYILLLLSSSLALDISSGIFTLYVLSSGRTMQWTSGIFDLPKLWRRHRVGLYISPGGTTIGGVLQEDKIGVLYLSIS